MSRNGSIHPDILAALGRLNTHARAVGGWGTERNAIYDYKTLATMVLVTGRAAS